jgi:ATPase subunit of ABC transporter with duplicated ATPase domains
MEGQLLLGVGKMSQKWDELSGGERQRAIIACGLFLSRGDGPLRGSEIPGKLSPDRPNTRLYDLIDSGAAATTAAAVNAGAGCVLLLDEPTAACDEAACAAVERALVESGVACVIVTHDHRQAERLAHTRILLS